MKRITLIKLILLSFLFSACEFSYSVKKADTTNYTSKPDGLNCKNISIERQADTNDNNIFFYGERVDIIFENVTGLKKINEKVYPKMSLFIIKNEKDTILFNNDLFEGQEGVEETSLNLRAYMVAVLPSNSGDRYKAHINIKDRNSDGSFFYELPFKVEKSNLLKVVSKNVEYSNAYLWNQNKKKGIFNKTIDLETPVMLIIEGVDGFEEKEGKVFPILSIGLRDADGENVIDSGNLFKDYGKNGVSAKDLKEQLHAEFTLNSGIVNNPYKLKVILKDTKSSKKLIVTSELNFK
ncbi:MAG: hypothetical protein JXR05_15140 [Flavobacteriaceae bacterium]